MIGHIHVQMCRQQTCRYGRSVVLLRWKCCPLIIRHLRSAQASSPPEYSSHFCFGTNSCGKAAASITVSTWCSGVRTAIFSGDEFWNLVTDIQSRTPARKVRCQISPKLKVCLFPSLLQSADTPRGAARMDSELRTTDKDRYLMRTSVPFSPCL